MFYILKIVVNILRELFLSHFCIKNRIFYRYHEKDFVLITRLILYGVHTVSKQLSSQEKTGLVNKKNLYLLVFIILRVRCRVDTRPLFEILARSETRFLDPKFSRDPRETRVSKLVARLTSRESLRQKFRSENRFLQVSQKEIL